MGIKITRLRNVNMAHNLTSVKKTLETTQTENRRGVGGKDYD